MIEKTRIVRICVLAAVLSLLAPLAVADRGGFVIKSFDAEILIEPDATVVVKERIVVHFSEPRRGIYRTIPVRYTDPKGFQYGLGFELVGVVDDNGAKHTIKLTHEGANNKIRIGRSDVTHTGEVVYNIRYRLSNALRQFEDHDELYWNVTGTNWATVIESASASVRLPGAVDDEALDISGYTGTYGSTEAAFRWTRLDTDKLHLETTRILNPHEGLSIAVSWPGGLVDFPGPVARTGRFLFNNIILLAPVFAFFGLWRRWRKIGRDPQGAGSVVVRYEPPDGLRPGEVGTVVDEKMDFRDLTATIVDLAVRGYLRIEVLEEEHLFGLITSKNVVFHRIGDKSTGKLAEYERLILDGIFYESDRTEAKDLAQRFYKEIPKIKKALHGRLVSNGYFSGDPSVTKTKYVLLGFLAAIVVGGAGALFGILQGAIFPNAMILPVVAAVLTAIVFFGFAPAMPRRTPRGVTARGWALGFEEFAERVESHKLEADRRRNVFESLLPYAMALGVAEKWAREFEGIYATGNAPDWYSGTRPLNAGITTAAFHRSLQSTLTQAASPMQASPRSSGSSGSGGGGSSGGGGGGGGGGSW